MRYVEFDTWLSLFCYDGVIIALPELFLEMPYRRSYIPWGWKIADISRCFKMALFFAWVAEDRLQRLKMMFLGVLDGLKGISGRRIGL